MSPLVDAGCTILRDFEDGKRDLTARETRHLRHLLRWLEAELMIAKGQPPEVVAKTTDRPQTADDVIAAVTLDYIARRIG